MSNNNGLQNGKLNDLIEQQIKRDTFNLNGWIVDRKNKQIKEIPKELSENVSFDMKKGEEKKLSKCKVFIKRSVAIQLKNKIQSEYDGAQKSYNEEVEKWKAYENSKKDFIKKVLDDLEKSLSTKENENLSDTVELQQVKNILFSDKNKAAAEAVFKIKANAEIKVKAMEVMDSRTKEISLGGGFKVQIFIDPLDKSEPYDAEITKLIPLKKAVSLVYEMNGVKKQVIVPLTNLCVIDKSYQSTKESSPTVKDTEENNEQSGGRKFQGGSFNYPTKKKISSEFSISTSSLCE